MRLFVAIDLESEVKDRISGLQWGLESFDSKIVEKQNFHLTLKFLGNVDDADATGVAKNLSTIKFRPFKVSLSKAGVFPNEDEPRVVWVGGAPSDELSYLRKAVNQVLKGFKEDAEDHESHITLARIKSLDESDYDKLFNAVKKIQKDISSKPIELEIKEITLFKSTMTKQGPIYEKISLKKTEK